MSTTTNKTNIQFMSDKIHALRLRYEKEQEAVARDYRSRIQDLERKIQSVKNTDFAAPYVQSIELSCATLERLFKEMRKVHDETRGLEFHIGPYADRCKPRNISRGQVLDHFEKVQKECEGAIRAVNKSRSVEDDVQPLKVFCQGLADLRYIRQNAGRLIAESGQADRERRAQLSPLQDQLEKLKRDMEKAGQLENLPCYRDAMSLRQQIMEEYDRLCENILGSGQMTFDGSYQFLVGFYQKEIAKEDRDFAVSTMKLPPDAVGREPIYFHYTALHDCILINAPAAFLESKQYNEFIRNLYFSFVSHLPARNLLFCGIECNTIEPVVGGLGEKIHQLGEPYILHEVVERGNDLTTTGGALDRLRSHANDNGKRQKGESIGDIFEYNEVFPDNPQKFAFFCVSNYPEGFNATSATALQDMRRLVNGGSKGIVSVICQTTDGRYNEYAPQLTAQELHADFVEFTQDGQMLYNGHPATFNITAPQFQPRDYWFKLGEYFKSSASISLEALLKSAENHPNKPKPISFPVGNADGDVFHLELTECTDKLFGLVIGTVGSGKSAFLHTLILSAAYTHSPEDLQFYLADFKDGSGSTEFSHYRKQEGLRNLYIPHVRYLLLKGKTESAFDLLEKIEAERSRRAEILSRTGYSQVTDYNNSPAVRSGKEKKLPHLVFVIDEYNAMLNGGQNAENSEVSGAITTKIKNLISTARAYGIGIILCGQSVDRALKNGQALGNMGCRISLPVKNDSELISLFDMDSYEARKQMQKLAGQGDALISLGNTSSVRYVRTAYSGKTNGTQQLRIAEQIRQKYKGFDLDQVEAGAESAVPVVEAAQYELRHRERDGELALEMGVSSANALRIPMVYSVKEESFNYYACAPREKLCKIERNAMFAFLRKTVGQGEVSGLKPVTYLALREKWQECLGDYFDQVPQLRQHIGVVETKTDIATTVMRLYKVYRERKRATDKGGYVDRSPMLVVLRDLLWLKDRDAEWLPEAKSRQKDMTQSAASLDMDIDGLRGKEELSVADIMSAIGGTSLSVSRMTAEADVDDFTAEDVRAAVATLFATGNRYGIYMLASSEAFKPVESILLREVDDIKLAQERYGIFGSFEESRTHLEDSLAPADCAYLTFFDSKIRLYDYDPGKCRSWWDELRRRWNN